MNKNINIEKTFELALENHKNKNFQIAKDLYKKILEINPNSAGVYYNLGILNKEIEKYQKAQDCYEKAIQINPNYTLAYINLGIMFKEQ